MWTLALRIQGMSLEPPDPCPSHTMSFTLAQKGPWPLWGCGLYPSDRSAGVEHIDGESITPKPWFSMRCNEAPCGTWSKTTWMVEGMCCKYGANANNNAMVGNTLYIYIHIPGNSFSWKNSGVSAFQWLQEFQVFDSATLPSGAISKLWESENVSSPSFWDLQICAGVLRVISNVFGGNFHFAQLNPQTLKHTLDIQLPFQKQGVLGVSGVWRQSPSFSEKSR